MPRIKNAKNLPKSKDKKLYKIGQLGELLNISPRSIRYLEQMGLFPHLKRSIGNTRLFDEDDIALIKKVFSLKDKYSYSLEKIRDIMLKKTSTKPEEIAIICDSPLNDAIHKNKQLNILTLNSQDKLNITTFNNELNKQQYPNLKSQINIGHLQEEIAKKPINRCFVILSENTYQRDYERLKVLKVPKVKFSFHRCRGFNSASRLLSEQLIERILKRDALEELDLLMNKQVPMIYQIGYTNHCKALLQNLNTKQSFEASPFIEQILNFKPVFIRDKDETNVKVCVNSEEAAVESLLESLNKELESRGLYCNRVLITHSQQESSAKKLQNTLQETLKDTCIHVSKMSVNECIEAGNNSIIVSII
eukprot:COSAG01_NODE_2_length_63927_cov_1357.611941_7_plen_363_part_00